VCGVFVCVCVCVCVCRCRFYCGILWRAAKGSGLLSFRRIRTLFY